jgi:hypothetical protein
MDATINKLGGAEANKCTLTIYGMAQEDVEPLTMLAFKAKDVPLNQLILSAGDDDDGMKVAFVGDILPGGAIADYSGSPEIKMTFTAMTGYVDMVTPAAPTSEKGVVDFMGLLTGIFGAAPTLSGENVTVENPCLVGSKHKQAKDLCEMLGYELIIDDGVIIVNKKDKVLEGNAPLITKDSGLIGYPSFSQTGIDFKCVYNPLLKFSGLVRVESVVPKATGTWKIIGLTHHITANIPGGAWESEVKTVWVE